MELYTLYQAYKRSRKGKRRSIDQVQFELNMFERLSRLCNSLNDRIYKPTSNYCFIHKRNKSREVWASEVELKIIQTILDEYLRPLIEERLTDRTFNNRIGYGTHAAINRVIEDISEVSNNYTKDAWIVKIDLKGYFPNINQDIAWGLVTELITSTYEGALRDELLYLAKVINYVNPQFNSQRRNPLSRWIEEIPSYKSLYSKSFGTGAAIGFLYWQVMSNYYLSDIDRWVINNITAHYTRFVDDMVMVVSTKTALTMLSTLRKKLRVIGVDVHPAKFYCQHYTKGLEFLGYHIKPYRLHLNKRIVRRAMYNCSKYSFRIDCKVNSYLGMIKCSSDDYLLKTLLDIVPDKGIIKDYDNFKIKILWNKKSTRI